MHWVVANDAGVSNLADEMETVVCLLNSADLDYYVNFEDFVPVEDFRSTKSETVVVN